MLRHQPRQMFNVIRGLVTSAVKAITGALNPPKPQPKAPTTAALPKSIAPVPAPSFAPIAQWGESAASVQARTQSWLASPGYKAQVQWQQNLAAQEAARRAAEEAARRAEEERQRREAARRAMQSQVDNTVRGATSWLSGLAKTATSWLSVDKKPSGVSVSPGKSKHEGFETQAEADAFYRWYAQQTPERQQQVDAYNQAKNTAKAKANELLQKSVKRPGTGFVAQFLDNITFGDTRRAQQQRQFAANQTDAINGLVSDFESKVSAYEKKHAALKAAAEASKLKGWAAYNAAYKALSDFENAEIPNLQKNMAGIEGLSETYSKAASKPISTRPARALNWLSSTVGNSLPAQTISKVFQYTLGAGDQNIPSLVTAPSRTVNWIGNMLDPTALKNYHQGKTTQGIEAGKNAWTATFNQRNLNFEQPKPVSKSEFISSLYKKLAVKETGKSLTEWYKANRGKLDSLYTDADRQKRETNYALEFMLDPLSLVSAGAKAAGSVARGSAIAGRLASSAPARFLESTKNFAPIKWALSEHKNYATRKNDFVQQELDDIYRKRPELRRLISNWQQNKNTIKATDKTAISTQVIKDFAGLDKIQIGAWQQYIRSGRDWSAVKSAPHLSLLEKRNLERLTNRYSSLFEQLRYKENAKGINTPYRTNYIPQQRQGFNLTSILKPRRRGNVDHT